MHFSRQDLLSNRLIWIGIMLFFTVGLFVSSTLGWLWYSEKRATLSRQSSLDLLWMEQSIINKLETQQVMLQNWVIDFDPKVTSSRDEFIKRINGMIKENHAILSIELIDKEHQRVIGLPEYETRPSNLPPLNDPLVSEAIYQSRSIHKTAYSRVIEQFAPLWVLALTGNNERLGLSNILITYDLDKLLTQEVPWWFIQRYDLSLVDKNDKQLSPSEGGMVVHSKEASRIDFGPSNSGLSLKTSMRSVQNFDHLLLSLAAVVFVFGVLIIWLLHLIKRWLQERRAAQQALRERRELLQYTARLSNLAEFASGMAHELNQPLAAIANYAAAAESLLNSGQEQSPKVRQAIEKMGKESHRAGKIMRSMRNFIQKTSNPHEPYSVRRLLDESIELIDVHAKRQQISIVLEFNVDDMMIHCDAVMLKQVLFNLMRNGLEAMKELPRDQKDQRQQLQIIVKQVDVYVMFSIVDQGHGIQEAEKLFQAFYTTKSEGMGLGLAICRTVIESHSGKIWAEANPNGGAMFHFRLPFIPY